MCKAGAITLRAAAEDDEPFLLRLYSGTREAELALVPWPAEAKRSFVESQFNAQCKHYRTAFPDAQQAIVTVGEEATGRFYVDRQAGQILIVDFTLLPQFQRQGVGQALISELQTEAASAGKAITGHVERWNPAQLFWQRMGFVLKPKDDVYFAMSWSGGAVSRAAT